MRLVRMHKFRFFKFVRDLWNTGAIALREEAAQSPISPYGHTKLVAERMLKEAEASHRIRHVTLRYFNAAGADPEGEIGEVHEPETTHPDRALHGHGTSPGDQNLW